MEKLSSKLSSALLMLSLLNCSKPDLLTYIDREYQEKEKKDVKDEDHDHKFKLPTIHQDKITFNEDEAIITMQVFDTEYNFDFHYQNEYIITKRQWSEGYLDEGKYVRTNRGKIETLSSKLIHRSNPVLDDLYKIADVGPSKNEILVSSSEGNLLINGLLTNNKLKPDKSGTIDISIKPTHKDIVLAYIDLYGGGGNDIYESESFKEYKEGIRKLREIFQKNVGLRTYNYDKISMVPEFKFDSIPGHVVRLPDLIEKLDVKYSIYVIKKEDIKDIKHQYETEEKIRVFKANEKSAFKNLLESSFRNLKIYINDADNGLPIKDVSVSITSDAKSPRDLLTDFGFKNIETYVYSLPSYPHSWSGRNWGSGHHCWSSLYNGCKFEVYTASNHKIIAKHPDYYQVYGIIKPYADGLEYIIEMSKIGTKIRLDTNPFGGKGTIRKN